MSATKLFDAGYRDLVSVIPPGATLSSTSSIQPERVGKIPGVRKADGTWVGYPWLAAERPTREECEKWDKWGANVGIKGTYYPAVDVDVNDPGLANLIVQHALVALGPAPIRTSKGSRRLLVYRTTEPFEKHRLTITYAGEKHAVEILADGQQFLVAGTHPSGVPYAWDGPSLSSAELALISRSDVSDFLGKLEGLLNGSGIPGLLASIDLGKTAAAGPAPEQASLLAPSASALADLVAKLPNRYADRESYVQFGCAVKAAGGDEAYPIFEEWALRWEGGANAPETVASDWSRMRAPFRIGWEWLQHVAQEAGVYNLAQEVFEVIGGEPPVTTGPAPEDAVDGVIQYTDTWVVEKIARAIQPFLRYVPATGNWHTWNEYAWAADKRNLAEHIIRKALLSLSRGIQNRASVHPVDEEKARLFKFAVSLQQRYALTKVVPELQSHPRVTIMLEELDVGTWILNTPAGSIDLRTGEMSPPDPALLLSKATSVAPAAGWEGTRWATFMEEVTGGDRDLQLFLQKRVGYALTASMQEQSLCFIHGPPNTGKSTFIGAVSEVLGTYHVVASPDTFAAAKGDRHPTELAKLAGARLVTTTETQEGKAWDTQRVKAITGGDRMTARFMRQDFFDFKPTFKVIVVGNYEPEIKGVDDAMMRRLHIVPFVHAAKEVHRDLEDVLRAESPSILAWAIEGCRLWLAEGLAPPEVVICRTREYQDEEDPVAMFLEECCELGKDNRVTRAELFSAWRQWCGQQGEEPGTAKQLKRRFAAKARVLNLKDRRVSSSRLNGYQGLSLRPIDYTNLER